MFSAAFLEGADSGDAGKQWLIHLPVRKKGHTQGASRPWESLDTMLKGKVLLSQSLKESWVCLATMLLSTAALRKYWPLTLCLHKRESWQSCS